MSVLRTEMPLPSGNFVQFPRSWRMDKRITGLPRDVLMHLWDNAAGWVIHNDALIRDLGVSKYALSKALRVLRDCGYLTDPGPGEDRVGPWVIHHRIADPLQDELGGGGENGTPHPLGIGTPNDTNTHTKNETAPARSALAAQPPRPSGEKVARRKSVDPARAAARAAAKRVNAATGANVHGVTSIILWASKAHSLTPDQAAEQLIELGTTGRPVTKASLSLVLAPDPGEDYEAEFARIQVYGALRLERPDADAALAALEEVSHHRAVSHGVADVDVWDESLHTIRDPQPAEAVEAVKRVATNPGPVRPVDVVATIRVIRDEARREEARQRAIQATRGSTAEDPWRVSLSW